MALSAIAPVGTSSGAFYALGVSPINTEPATAAFAASSVPTIAAPRRLTDSERSANFAAAAAGTAISHAAEAAQFADIGGRAAAAANALAAVSVRSEIAAAQTKVLTTARDDAALTVANVEAPNAKVVVTNLFAAPPADSADRTGASVTSGPSSVVIQSEAALPLLSAPIAAAQILSAAARPEVASVEGILPGPASPPIESSG